MTRGEILKKHTDKYRTLRVINQSVIEQIEKSVGEAMEEWGKQEALAFNFFYINNKMKYLGWDFEDIYNEYQQSKTK